MYSQQLLDHLQHPRHKGDLAEADATGEAYYQPCGDSLRLTMRVQDGHVASVGFTAFGCPAAKAAGSAASELLLGKSVEEARSLDAFELDKALGGVPPAKRHALLMVLQCLHQALGPRPASSSMQPQASREGPHARHFLHATRSSAAQADPPRAFRLSAPQAPTHPREDG